MTQIYGLLGKNIGYSLSPGMHNAAFGYFGIGAKYELFDREEDELEDFFQELLSGEIGGINITVPYKIKIKDMLESSDGCFLEKDAKSVGAVNTIKIKDLELTGFNTDGEGFYESLLEDLDFDPKGKKIFIIGAGGAGRTIFRYMIFSAKKRPEEIYIYDVDKERLSSAVLPDSEKKFKDVKTARAVKEGEFDEKASGSDLIINATPIGTKEGDCLPFGKELLHKGMFVYDLVYARETELIKAAREKRIPASGGLGMLVNQAAIAFNIWTGKGLLEIKNVMRGALPAALKENYKWNI